MTVNAINGSLLSALSAIDGVSLASISEIDGIAKAAGSGPSVANDAHGGANAVNHSFAMTCSGSNRVLLVFAYYWSSGRTISGITYNSVALTQLTTQVDAGGNRTVELWYLVAPDTGSNTLALTGTGAAAEKQMHALCIQDALQSAPTAGSSNGNSSTPSGTITGAVGDLFVDGLGTNSQFTGGDPDAGQTEYLHFITGAQGLGASTKAGAASTTMSWTLTGSCDWAQIRSRIQPA